MVQRGRMGRKEGRGREEGGSKRGRKGARRVSGWEAGVGRVRLAARVK